MTRSMTGFGRSDQRTGAGLLVWELRAVNHRHLELQIRLPEELRALEPAVRERVAAQVRRGKVDCTLRLEARPEEGGLVLHQPLVDALVAVVRGLPVTVTPLRAIDILRWPGVLSQAVASREDLEPMGLALLDQALAAFQEQRSHEGARLVSGLRERVALLRLGVVGARALLPELVPEFRRRLVARLRDLGVALEASRIEQELALLAQRSDVTEELDRLDAHAEGVEQILRSTEPIGRRLDFMMQELNREANTLGSKATDLRLTGIAVDLKVTIEQMREQIQNIE